jgi:stage II sporulation protein D
LAAYHAISAGKTETAKNVWGTDYPYLQSENSVADLLCSEFYSEVIVPKDEFLTKLVELGVENARESEKIIGENKKSDSGTVLNISLCGKNFTGAQIRKAFNLRSAVFDLILKEDSLVFTVSGYGHGIGMSQFGANYMAQQGSDYKEIITAYYRDIEIIELK